MHCCQTHNKKVADWLEGQQQTWVTHIMNAGGKDHGGNLQISQFLGKLVVGQKAA